MRSVLIIVIMWLRPPPVHPSCSPAVCIHGACINDVCKCDSSFAGPDCSIPFETCDDGERTCYNGSDCVRNNKRNSVTNKYDYHCDCSKAFAMDTFAGVQCEYAATTVCELQKERSTYAFCTNGGDCIRKVVSGKPHAGCKCPPEFEGRHCQYRRGEAPPNELGSLDSSNSGSMSGIVGVLTSIIVITVVGSFAYFLWKKKTASEKESLEVTAVSDTEGAHVGGGNQERPSII